MVNIIICGTPGTGKSTLIEKLKLKLPEFNYINLSQFAIDHDCIESYDEALDTRVIDEDKLDDSLKKFLDKKENNIFECIHSDLLCEIDIGWIFVCRTDNTKLFDRLKARDYNEAKISNNLEAEIFQLVYDEAVSAFGETLITQLVNDEESDLDKNVASVAQKISSLTEFVKSRYRPTSYMD